MSFRKFMRATRYALSGVKQGVLAQPNFRYYVLVMLVIAVINFFLDFDAGEWLICFGVSLIIIVAELLNTSVETLCDLYSTEFHPKIKIIKDVAAGAVFVAITAALLIYAGMILEKI